MGQPPLYEPKDKALFDAAIAYCHRELAATPDFVRLNKMWVCIAEPVFDNGQFVSGEICGITGYVLKADIPVFRVTGKHSNSATKLFHERYQAFFADQGLRGAEVFLHISGKETPEQRCPQWKENLLAAGAVPADRYVVIVR